MKYIDYVNKKLKESIAEQSDFIVYGQNVNSGSRLGGLTKNLASRPGHHIINTPNSENTLAGVGLGMLLQNQSSLFACKQLDFLLLSIDQFTNTWNILRENPITASFTIMAIVVDTGFAGPQSSFNNAADICHLANIQGFTVTSTASARFALEKISSPGFRLITLSEKLFHQPVIEIDAARPIAEGLIEYKQGSHTCFLACNHSLPDALSLAQNFDDDKPGIIGLHSLHSINHKTLILALSRYDRVILLDDTKSARKHSFLKALIDQKSACNVLDLSRTEWESRPNQDRYSIPQHRVKQFFETSKVF